MPIGGARPTGASSLIAGRAKCTPPSAKIAAVSANSDRRWCEVVDLGGNLLREDAPEADDLVVPRIGCLARTAQEECADRLS
jgi:hypothetical protein